MPDAPAPEFEARLRRILAFGVECLRDPLLDPLDGWGLAVLAAWPLMLTRFRGVTAGRNRLRATEEDVQRLLERGAVASHARVRRSKRGEPYVLRDIAALALDLARAGVSVCKPFPLPLALCGFAPPAPDAPVERVASWFPYMKAFDVWTELRFLPSGDSARRAADPSLRLLDEKWTTLGDAEVRPLFAAEDVLKPFRGAVKRSAARAGVDRRRVWTWAREVYASPMTADPPRVVLEQLDRDVAFAVLSRLAPSASADAKRLFGFSRVGPDGFLRWNYGAAADRLIGSFLKRRELPETDLSRRGDDSPRSLLADAVAPAAVDAVGGTDATEAVEAVLRARVETLGRKALETVTAKHERAAREYAWLLWTKQMTITEAARRAGCARQNVGLAWKQWRARLKADPVIRRLDPRG